MYVFANWKTYLSHTETLRLATTLRTLTLPTEVTLGIFPPLLSLAAVQELLADSTVIVGAQDCSQTPQGAYTGAISIPSITDIGVSTVLIGHSERRTVFHERDDVIQKKLQAVLAAQSTAILCIGETAEERETGQRRQRLQDQLSAAVTGISISSGKLLIAYEPLWAIGSGLVCEPDEAAQVAETIRDATSAYTAAAIPVLYGGSVSASTVGAFQAQKGIDGVLVGRASTTATGLNDIIQALT